MTKRIYDIIPPEEIESVSNETEENFDLNQGPLTNTIIPVTVKKRKGKFPFTAVFLMLLLGGLITGAILMPAKAQVTIYPKTEVANFSNVILISSEATEVNFETNTLPGKVFSDTQSYSQTYSATGNSENSTKARGTIRVYNKYSPAEPLTLKTGTHFLSDPKGLSYHSLTAINIPAATIEGSKITPGYVDIIVEADEAGEEYNLTSATFSVPKLKGTPYYTTTWAETRGAIQGGTNSAVKIVTKTDIDSAKEDFKAKSFAYALTSLKNKVEKGYVVFDKAVSQEMTELNITAKEKDITPTFEVKGTVISKAIIFKESDLKALAEKLFFKNQDNNTKSIVPDSLACEVSKSKIDIQAGRAELEISCQAKIYWAPDKEFLIKSLSGKSKDYSASIIKNFSGVDNAEINLWPVWKFNLPNNNQNITIEVEFN